MYLPDRFIPEETVTIGDPNGDNGLSREVFETEECREPGCTDEGVGMPPLCDHHSFVNWWGPQVGECGECGGRLCRNRWGDDGELRVTCYDCRFNVPESDHDPIDPSDW